MPCSPLPFNVFLQLPKIDPPCIGWSRCLNLRSWHHAQVTSTIPALIKKALCRQGKSEFASTSVSSHVRHVMQTVSIRFIHSFCRLVAFRRRPVPSVVYMAKHLIHDQWDSECNLLVLPSFCSGAFRLVSACGWKIIPPVGVIYLAFLFLSLSCNSSRLLLPKIKCIWYLYK